MRLVGVTPLESVMVGDSLEHDIWGAQRAGIRGILIERSEKKKCDSINGVSIIRTLDELPELLTL